MFLRSRLFSTRTLSFRSINHVKKAAKSKPVWVKGGSSATQISGRSGVGCVLNAACSYRAQIKHLFRTLFTLSRSLSIQKRSRIVVNVLHHVSGRYAPFLLTVSQGNSWTAEKSGSCNRMAMVNC